MAICSKVKNVANLNIQAKIDTHNPGTELCWNPTSWLQYSSSVLIWRSEMYIENDLMGSRGQKPDSDWDEFTPWVENSLEPCRAMRHRFHCKNFAKLTGRRVPIAANLACIQANWHVITHAQQTSMCRGLGFRCTQQYQQHTQVHHQCRVWPFQHLH